MLPTSYCSCQEHTLIVALCSVDHFYYKAFSPFISLSLSPCFPLCAGGADRDVLVYVGALRPGGVAEKYVKYCTGVEILTKIPFTCTLHMCINKCGSLPACQHVLFTVLSWMHYNN